MKRVLVTGWRGFVGKNLVQYLEQHGYQVIKFQGDITNEVDVSENFNDSLYAVIHLAAYGNDSSHNQQTPAGIAKTLRVNVLGTTNLLSEFINSQARVFINTGSSSEYGTHNQQLSPKTVLEGPTPYARTKAAISTLLDGLHVDGKFFKTMRLFSVYGPYEKENRLIPTVFSAAQTGATMPIVNAVHDFVYVSDVCRAYLHLLEMPEICPPITHAASGRQYSNQEVVDLISEITGKTVNTYPVRQLRSFDTSNKWVSSSRSILVGPEYTLEQGLRKVWQFLQSN